MRELRFAHFPRAGTVAFRLREDGDYDCGLALLALPIYRITAPPLEARTVPEEPHGWLTQVPLDITEARQGDQFCRAKGREVATARLGTAAGVVRPPAMAHEYLRLLRSLEKDLFPTPSPGGLPWREGQDLSFDPFSPRVSKRFDAFAGRVHMLGMLVQRTQLQRELMRVFAGPALTAGSFR